MLILSWTFWSWFVSVWGHSQRPFQTLSCLFDSQSLEIYWSFKSKGNLHLCSCLNTLLQKYTAWVTASSSISEYPVNVYQPNQGWQTKPRLLLSLMHFGSLEHNLKCKPLGMQALQWLTANKVRWKPSIWITAVGELVYQKAKKKNCIKKWFHGSRGWVKCDAGESDRSHFQCEIHHLFAGCSF